MSGINDLISKGPLLDERTAKDPSASLVARRLLPYFKPHGPRLALALAAMAGVAGLTAGAMWILKQVIDRALLDRDLAMLADTVLLVLLLYFAKAALSYVHDYVTAYIGQAIVKQLRDQAYNNIHNLSLDFYTGTDSARVIARLTNDAQLVQNALTKIPIMIVRDGLTVVALTGFLFYLHWRYALIAFSLLHVSGYLIAPFG